MAAAATITPVRATFGIHFIAKKMVRPGAALCRATVDFDVVNEIRFQMY